MICSKLWSCSEMVWGKAAFTLEKINLRAFIINPVRVSLLWGKGVSNKHMGRPISISSASISMPKAKCQRMTISVSWLKHNWLLSLNNNLFLLTDVFHISCSKSVENNFNSLHTFCSCPHLQNVLNILVSFVLYRKEKYKRNKVWDAGMREERFH